MLMSAPNCRRVLNDASRLVLRRGLSKAGTSTLLLLALSAGVAALEFKAGEIEVEHPWSRQTPGGAQVAAGYVVIRNQGASPDRLVSAAAEVAGHTEIHEMAVADGVMTMRSLPDGVEIPANGEVVLKPGGRHLMFLELKRPLKKGESFSGSLVFEKAGTVKVSFSVAAMGATEPDHEGHNPAPAR